MTAITGGLVSVEDGTKSDVEFQPARKVRVELRFDLPSDDKNPCNTLDYASALATNQVNKLLGRQHIAGPILPDGDPRIGQEIDASGETKAGPPTEAAKKTRAKAAPAAEPPKDTSGSATDAQPASQETSASTPQASSQPSSEQPPAGDEWDTPVEPVTTITDQDLNAAATKRNTTLNDPVKIRNLIGEFNPDPSKQFSLSQIPQAQRKLFLERLEALS